MDLTKLSNEEIALNLSSLTGTEREVTVKILFHLIECESRAYFRDLGFSNLFDYCTRGLKYSNASAYRRITAARCLRENPELEGLFRSGEVNLCTVATAAKSIEKKTTSVAEIAGVSQREVERIVARTEPVPTKPTEIVKPVVVCAPAPALLGDQSQQEERVSLRFSLTKEAYEELEEARAKLSNALGKELSLEAVVMKLTRHFLKPATKRVKVRTAETRYIPKAVKRAVYERDCCQCRFVSDGGTRCTEKRYLQIDHILPFARGGQSELSNLRLLCPAHNRLMAERHFGKGFIENCVGSNVGSNSDVSP